MASRVRQKQLFPPTNPDDQLSAVQIASTEASTEMQQFWNGVLSQIKRMIFGDAAGDWFADPATVFGGDASLRALFLSTGGGGGTSTIVQSDSGQFTVPSGSAVGELVYSSGSFGAAQADNSGVGTAPAMGLIVSKPTAVTGTIAFFGRVGGFSALTPGANLFLGVGGSIIEAGNLPTAPGSVVQKIGEALDATTILLNPKEIVVL